MSKIKKITITIETGLRGQQEIGIETETTDTTDKLSGAELIGVLIDAIATIVDEIS